MSITQADGGPIRTEIKVKPSPDFKVGPFSAVDKPDVHPEPEFKNLPVEKHVGKVTWSAPLEIAAGVDPDGYFVTPTLYGPVPQANSLACEEVFGPLLVLLPFEDEDDAVALANGTAYGLVAAVWTRDGGRQLRVARRLRSGQVFVNAYGAGAGIELPFGGTGKSGHGREKGMAALRALVSKADVFIQNLKPGAVAKLGFPIAELRRKYPKLIVCSVSGYGEDGPYANRKAYDLLIQAESGLASITGGPTEPARVGVSVCDVAAGMNAYEAILEALIATQQRRATKEQESMQINGRAIRCQPCQTSASSLASRLLAMISVMSCRSRQRPLSWAASRQYLPEP